MSTALQITLVIVGGMCIISLIGAITAGVLFRRVEKASERARREFESFTQESDRKFEQRHARMDREHQEHVARIRKR